MNLFRRMVFDPLRHVARVGEDVRRKGLRSQKQSVSDNSGDGAFHLLFLQIMGIARPMASVSLIERRERDKRHQQT